MTTAEAHEREMHTDAGPAAPQQRAGPTPTSGDDRSTSAAVDLYWIPLGAGSPLVQASGHLFETVSARWHRRPPCDLYHAALQVVSPLGCFSIEQAPVPDRHGEARGVVAVGPVGIRAAGRLRVFRYEVRCWRDGTIPDLADAVNSPLRLTTDAEIALRILELLPSIPTLVWGHDEARTGEMWNSNSVIAWVLTGSGVDLEPIRPPPNGARARMGGRSRRRQQQCSIDQRRRVQPSPCGRRRHTIGGLAAAWRRVPRREPELRSSPAVRRP